MTVKAIHSRTNVPRDGQIILIAGQQGSGKTFAANHLVRRDKYVLAYDQTGFLFERGRSRFDRFDGVTVTTPREVTSEIIESLESDTGFRIAFVDVDGRHRDWFLRIVKKWTDSPGPGKKPARPLTVWFEEAHKTFPRDEPRGNPGVKLLDELMRTSRHRRLNVIFTTQDASDLPLKFRRDINSALIFRHTQPTSVEYVTDVLGDRKFGRTVRDLRQGNFLELKVTGQVFGPKRIAA